MWLLTSIIEFAVMHDAIDVREKGIKALVRAIIDFVENNIQVNWIDNLEHIL